MNEVQFMNRAGGRGGRLALIAYTLYAAFITDAFLFTTYSNELFRSFNRFSVIFLGISLFFLHIVKGNHRVPKMLFFCMVSVIISMFLAGRFLSGYFYYTFLALLWIGYYVSNKWYLDEFATAYCNLFILVAVISLLGWIFRSFIINLGIFPVLSNKSGINYISLFFTNIPLRSNAAARNMGPYWEPGAYQFFLVVALFFTLFIVNMEKRKKLFCTILFTITAISTLSGVVIFPLMLIFAAYFLEQKNAKAYFLVILAFVGFYFVYQSDFFARAVTKFTGESDSLYFRLIGIEGPIRAFLKNPLFGSSPEVNDMIKSQLAQKYLGVSYGSNANTFFNFFGYYGILIGTFAIVNLYRMVKSCCDNRLVCLLLFFALIISSSNENFTGSLFVVTLLFLRKCSNSSEVTS